MDMIGLRQQAHIATLNLHTCSAKHVAINLVISILEEDCLATNSALGHVVRKTRNDHARADSCRKTIATSGE
jgi:hypothetical protein